MNRRELLAGAAAILGAEKAQAFGIGQLGLGEGHLGALGRVGGINAALPKFAAAVASARSGGAPARILVAGHSYVAGGGAGTGTIGNHFQIDCARFAWSTVLAQKLSPKIPTVWHSLVGDQNAPSVPATIAQVDTRVTLGSGWASDTGAGMLGCHLVVAPGGSTGFLDLVPGFSPVSVKIWYPSFNGASSTSLGVYADGVLVGSIDQGTGFGSLLNASFSIPGGTSKISLKNNDASQQARITFIECFPASTVAVLAQAGWMGGLSSNFTVSGQPYNIIPASTAFAPHLCLIDLMTNDIFGSTPPSTWAANVQTYINSVKTTADIIIICDPPASGMTVAQMDSFYNAALGLQAVNGGLVLDMRTIFGPDFATGNALGLWSPDATHPSRSGHDAIAQYVASQIVH